MIVNQLESPPLESDKTQNKKSADQAVQADKKRAGQRGWGVGGGGTAAGEYRTAEQTNNMHQ